MLFLITGATGFIGPHLIRRLKASGHVCRCLVRDPSKAEKILKGFDVELATGDITQPESLNGIADGVDYLLHLATLGHMSNFTVTETMFETINVQGTVNIMTEALRAGVKKIVHCSSVAAMGICPDVPTSETSPCLPHHPYGRSKLKAENTVLQMILEKGLPAVIVRFSMVYGPGDPRDMLKLTRLKKKGFLPKIGDRAKLTPLIHVEDAVTGLLSAAEKGKIGEIYLLTNAESEPFDRIGKIIEGALGVYRPSIYLPEWVALAIASVLEKIFTAIGKVPPVTRKNIESTLADRVFSIKKVQKELGFEPLIDPETGIRDTVLWYKRNGWV